MITSCELAQALLARLHKELGSLPMVEQVDFVVCEGGSDMMAYIYHDDECTPVLIQGVTKFDQREVEDMVRRRLVSVRVH